MLDRRAEFATLTWVAWCNGSRLLEPLGYVPPIEFEEAFYSRRGDPAENGFQGCPGSTIGPRYDSGVRGRVDGH